MVGMGPGRGREVGQPSERWWVDYRGPWARLAKSSETSEVSLMDLSLCRGAKAALGLLLPGALRKGNQIEPSTFDTSAGGAPATTPRQGGFALPRRAGGG